MELASVFKLAFFFFLAAKFLVQIGLNIKNSSYIRCHREQVPAKFNDSVELAQHQRAADYTIVKSKVGRWNLAFDLVLLLFWLPGGGLAWLDQLVGSFFWPTPLIHGTLFFLSFALISAIINLPWSLYDTFVIEQRFGFNKTTPKRFMSDLFKQLILGLLIGGPLLMGLLWIMEKLGRYWWFYAWIFLTLFQLILVWAYPKFISPLFNKFEELEEGELKEKVKELLKRCHFSFSGLFVMNASIRSSHGNAYFTGLGKNKRIVFFDTLIKTLNPSEVEAILAHELGHFKLNHIKKGLIRSIFFSLVGFFILGLLANLPSFYVAHWNHPSFYMAIMLFSLITPLYTFFLTPLFSWISRKYEFEADRFAAKHADGQALIHALVKLYKDNASSLTPDPLYSAFYHSHPPALERVEHLEQCNKENRH